MSLQRRIQYVTTSDGVRIAYAVTGSGPPLVFVTEPVISHTDLEWSHPIFGAMLSRLAEHNTLVRYDSRGTGLSDRIPTSAEGGREDLRAVVDRVGLDSFALCAVQLASSPGISFAARNPHRVRQFVLIDGFARMTDFLATPHARAVLSAVLADYALGTEMIGPTAFGAGRDESVAYGAYIRQCIDKDFFTILPEPFDVSDDAARLAMPVLLLRHAGLGYVTMDMTKDLASRIKGAQLTVVQGGWADDPVGLADRVNEFVKSGSSVERTSEMAPTTTASGGTAVILFTDIVDSTALTERMGDARFRDASRALDAGLRAAIRDAGGAAIDGKLLGDGVLATFPSAAQAIDGARRCLALSAASELGLHIGLHAGDVIREEGNVYGGAVNIASRICGLSAPEEILVSDVVRGMARSSAGVEFEDRGEQEMKGVGEPVRVYAVRWREDG